MNTTPTPEHNTTPGMGRETAMGRALELLVEAGITFTEVDTCPTPTCEMCTTNPVRTAA